MFTRLLLVLIFWLLTDADFLDIRHFTGDIHIQFTHIGGACHLVCQVINAAVSIGLCITPEVCIGIDYHCRLTLRIIRRLVYSEIAVSCHGMFLSGSLHKISEPDSADVRSYHLRLQ